MRYCHRIVCDAASGLEFRVGRPRGREALLNTLKDRPMRVRAVRGRALTLQDDLIDRRLRDVRDLKALPREVELIAGGFPCQDLSQAGQTLGIGGSRSGLVGEIFRLLDRRRVPWVVLENVSFMLQLDKGSGMRTLVEAFEERGYRWAYRVVNSLSFLPQRRERR